MVYDLGKRWELVKVRYMQEQRGAVVGSRLVYTFVHVAGRLHSLWWVLQEFVGRQGRQASPRAAGRQPL